MAIDITGFVAELTRLAGTNTLSDLRWRPCSIQSQQI
jgi:hypothetical protein